MTKSTNSSTNRQGHTVEFVSQIRQDGDGFSTLKLTRKDTFDLATFNPESVPDHLRDTAIFPEIEEPHHEKRPRTLAGLGTLLLGLIGVK